jgi:hypothetical protein
MPSTACADLLAIQRSAAELRFVDEGQAIELAMVACRAFRPTWW